ncbi:hypothetical protein Lal_00007553 [Lupinus albus]|nr:hypothetical protein Lal_00007553 [Lupinus albus]
MEVTPISRGRGRQKPIGETLEMIIDQYFSIMTTFDSYRRHQSLRINSCLKHDCIGSKTSGHLAFRNDVTEDSGRCSKDGSLRYLSGIPSVKKMTHTV